MIKRALHRVDDCRSIVVDRRKQCLQILGAEARLLLLLRLLVDAGGEGPLALLHGEYAFLDCLLCDQLVDEHRLVLADAVGAVGGLGLDRRVLNYSISIQRESESGRRHAEGRVVARRLTRPRRGPG